MKKYERYNHSNPNVRTKQSTKDKINFLKSTFSFKTDADVISQSIDYYYNLFVENQNNSNLESSQSTLSPPQQSNTSPQQLNSSSSHSLPFSSSQKTSYQDDNNNNLNKTTFIEKIIDNENEIKDKLFLINITVLKRLIYITCNNCGEKMDISFSIVMH